MTTRRSSLTGPEVVVVDVPSRADRARQLADELGLRVVQSEDEAGEALRLADAGGVLELRDAGTRPGRGVRVRLEQLDVRPGSRSLSRRQPLARAIGASPSRVVDATAGLGQDTLLMAALGHEVIAIERHVVLGALLREALARAARLEDEAMASVVRRVELRVGDALSLLPHVTPPPDVVYLDPMFPPKRKATALAPKPIRIVRRLVGDDLDAAALLEIARDVALRRVVVKRPTRVAPLAEDVLTRHQGKLVTYDVFATRRRDDATDRRRG